MHNFRRFTIRSDAKVDCSRQVTDASMTVTDYDRCGVRGRLLTCTFTGKGFMQYQIRFMVGGLLQVGRGDITEAQFDSLLSDPDAEEKFDRCKAHAKGLTLKYIKFKEGKVYSDPVPCQPKARGAMKKAALAELEEMME